MRKMARCIVMVMQIVVLRGGQQDIDSTGRFQTKLYSCNFLYDD